MRVDDKRLKWIAKGVAAGPNWTPSEVDGYMEPQACMSRREAEDLIEDLSDLRKEAKDIVDLWRDPSRFGMVALGNLIDSLGALVETEPGR